MKEEDLEILKMVIPGIIAVVGQLIIYLIIKEKIDKSIERHKISYSGVFKEKLDIYKELLKKTYDLKYRVQQYQYFGDEEMAVEIKQDFNKYNRFCLMNKPFLSDQILNNLQQLRTELQVCFEDFYMHNSLRNKNGIPTETLNGLLKNFFDSGNKFKANNPFETLENLIVLEMRQDLKIANV